MTKQEQRDYIEDLVRHAQQKMTDEEGAAKMDFVLSEFHNRFSWFPIDVARTLAEAAVNRMKNEHIEVQEIPSLEVIEAIERAGQTLAMARGSSFPAREDMEAIQRSADAMERSKWTG